MPHSPALNGADLEGRGDKSLCEISRRAPATGRRTRRAVGGRALVPGCPPPAVIECGVRGQGIGRQGALPAAFCPRCSVLGARSLIIRVSSILSLAPSSTSAYRPGKLAGEQPSFPCLAGPFCSSISWLPTTHLASTSSMLMQLSSEVAKILLINTFSGFFQIIIFFFLSPCYLAAPTGFLFQELLHLH